jgi:hypothetical protein
LAHNHGDCSQVILSGNLLVLVLGVISSAIKVSYYKEQNLSAIRITIRPDINLFFIIQYFLSICHAGMFITEYSVEFIKRNIATVMQGISLFSFLLKRNS